MTDSFYKYHLFFCTNKRAEGESCCQNHNGLELRNYMKKRTKELKLIHQGVRANTAGCLNRCKQGPVLVIYPEAVWYTFKNETDIDEITPIAP